MGKKSRRRPSKAVREEARRNNATSSSNVTNPAPGVIVPKPPPNLNLLREQANQLMAQFLHLSETSGNKWNMGRVECLLRYYSMMGGVTQANDFCGRFKFATKEDRSFLKSIYHNQEELSSIRVIAVKTWGKICYNCLDCEGCILSQHVSLKLLEDVSEFEKGVLGADWFEFPRKSSIESLSSARLSIRRVVSPNGGVQDIPCFGGHSCDACGKETESIEDGLMQCCWRCKVSYYCSKECQQLDWTSGHKDDCRKKGEVKVGDPVRYPHVGPTGSLQGIIVFHVLAPVYTSNQKKKKKPIKWLVSNRSLYVPGEHDVTCFVRGEHLKRERPRINKDTGLRPTLEKTHELMNELKASSYWSG